MSAIELPEFYRDYSRALRDGSAALFVGAGLSVAAGFVDWKRLLEEVAEDLGLDVARESDLVALAQFHENKRQGRDRINSLIMDHFVEGRTLTPNHEIIASLPVRSVWTTNYDELLEEAFKLAEKRADVKRRQSDFATNRKNADVVIYKMHGDVTDPPEAVLTKDDYETYNSKRELFTTALRGELVGKTFLFLGFSFKDPNVEHILGRVRQLLEDNARQHYCILKRPKPGECGDDDYSCRRFDHHLADLRRYKVIPVLVDSYGEVTAILQELRRRAHLRDVFISGSAEDVAPLGTESFDALCFRLGEKLIENGFNIISGYGVGVGGTVILGAMRSLRRNDDERLKLWPFPQKAPKGHDLAACWRTYRERMLKDAGVCIVISGNKADGDTIVAAEGVREEVAIARKEGAVIVPVGATGFIARELWEEAVGDPKSYFGTARVDNELQVLGDEAATPEQLVDAIVSVLKRLER